MSIRGRPSSEVSGGGHPQLDDIGTTPYSERPLTAKEFQVFTTYSSAETDEPSEVEVRTATRTLRLRSCDDLEVDAERSYFNARQATLAKLRKDHPTAPSSTLAAWADRERDVIRAHHRLVKVRTDRDSIEKADPVTIQPTDIERRVADAGCESRRRAWGRFTRQLQHEVGRRRAWQRRQNTPARTTGRTARPSTSTRSRGSKRTTRTSSSSGGGDSGSSGDPDPAGPAQTSRETDTEHEGKRRYCRGCGLRLIGYAPQARDHGPACTTRWRRRGKVDAEWVDGVEYGPGVQTAAEIAAAIRRYRSVELLHEQVRDTTTAAEVQVLIEQAVVRRREAWLAGDGEKAADLDHDLTKLWEEFRRRRMERGAPVYRNAPGRRLYG